MKTITRILLALVLTASTASAQIAEQVEKTTANNRITGDLNFGSGRTLTLESGSTLTLDISHIRAALDVIGTTRGAIFYRGASGWVLLSPGTSGYVLTSNGAGADPSWEASTGSGGGITDIVQDTTPQLGGNLDLNGFSITGLVIGTNVQAWDADLDDLADGSLTGSKVGTGISGDNVTTGTIADARIASTIARDSEVAAAYLGAASAAPAANRVWVSGGADRTTVSTPVTINPSTGAMSIPTLDVDVLTAQTFTPADSSIAPGKINPAGATTGQALIFNGTSMAFGNVSGSGAADTVVTSWPETPTLNSFYFNSATGVRRYYIASGDYWESAAYTLTDGTAPTITGAQITTVSDAERITLTASEATSIGAGGGGGLALTLSGGAVTATHSSGLIWTLSRRIASTETGTVSYTQPGNGMEDAAGNNLATFTGFAIDNDSVYSPSLTVETFSDLFTRSDSDNIGANWTEVVGAWNISSNQLRANSGSYAKALAIYSGQVLAGNNGYVRVRFSTLHTTSFAEIVFRYTDGSSAFNSVQFAPDANTIKWQYYANSAATSSTIQTINQAVDSGDVWGMTWEGTDTGMIVRVWRNPTATAPTATDSWDGAAATQSFTTDPGTPVNTGTLIGLLNYQSSANLTLFDDLYFGAIY